MKIYEQVEVMMYTRITTSYTSTAIFFILSHNFLKPPRAPSVYTFFAQGSSKRLAPPGPAPRAGSCGAPAPRTASAQALPHLQRRAAFSYKHF